MPYELAILGAATWLKQRARRLARGVFRRINHRG